MLERFAVSGPTATSQTLSRKRGIIAIIGSSRSRLKDCASSIVGKIARTERGLRSIRYPSVFKIAASLPPHCAGLTRTTRWQGCEGEHARMTARR